MGVPALFRWLSKKYPKIVSQVIEEQPQQIDGQEIPIDISGPNPNAEEFDNLYLDMNGIVHPCSHPEDRPAPANEEEMMVAIFKYTNRVVNMVRPRKLLMIAVDGVAPRAKMNQQRSRRFRSAQEAKEKDEEKQEFLKMLKAQNGGVIDGEAEKEATKKTWDSNSITPGTPFMDILAASLRYWCAYKLNTDPGWAELKVIISDATVPGEGEHKIMQFIRSQRSTPQHDPNTRHVMYGLDADLIMLGLATHEPHFRVLREDVFFQESKARTCKLCGQKGHVAEACRGLAAPKEGEFGEKDKALADKPFIWLHVSVLREYLEAELWIHGQPFRFDLERAIDDWIFMCFFVGNDFLPHLPSLDIREDGIDTLIAIWRDNIPLMGSYLTKDGKVDLERAQFILDGLAKQEDTIFRRRKQTEDRREANNKRRKLEDERRQSGRQSGGASSYTPNGRRGSPDYGNVSQNSSHSKRKNGVPAIAPPDMPLFAIGAGAPSREERAITHELVVNRNSIDKANHANKSAAQVLKNQLKQNGTTTPQDSSDQGDKDGEGDAVTGASSHIPTSGLKRKASEINEQENGGPAQNGGSGTQANDSKSDDPPPDTVRLWEEGYADRYYEQKFKVDPKDIAFRNQVAKDYVEGLAWVLLYYLQGCPSWTWFYPHHYAPFAADFVDLKDVKIKFEKGQPFKPFEQLMGVLPAASQHAIPEIFRPLMTDPDSEIIDFYPEEFHVDLNGKKFAWQGVAILPFIEEQRLLDAMSKKYPLLSAEDTARNEVGKDALILADSHPFYDDLSSHFYSKQKGAPSYKIDPLISKGLAGMVQKNEDFIPQTSLAFPLETIDSDLPSLDGDRSMSVFYDMPQSIHIHKSMLLRGLKMPQPVLESADLEATATKAQRSGRSFGGAPLREERQHGRRGGRINYGNDRFNPNPENPISKHLDPNFAPPPQFSSHGSSQYAPSNQGCSHQQQYPRGQDYRGDRPPPNGNPQYNQHQYNGYNQQAARAQVYSQGHYQPPAPPQSNYGPSGGYGQYPNSQYQRR